MSSKSKDPQEVYKYVPHGPWIQTAGKQWCFSCGLVALNNKASDWCIDKGCLYDLHSGYSKAMKKLTRHRK